MESKMSLLDRTFLDKFDAFHQKHIEPLYPNEQRERLIYEITSLITDDINCASTVIEDMILIYTKDQMNEMEDIIVNHYGVEHV